MMRRLLIAAAVLGLLTAIGAVIAVSQLRDRIATAYQGYPDAEVFIDVNPGDSTRVIAERLVAAGVVPDAWTFRIAVWQSERERDLQAGEYMFNHPVSPLEVVEKIATGQVVLRTITFPEGLTIHEMANIFDASDFGTGDQFMAEGCAC